jgi:hypothetical protein
MYSNGGGSRALGWWQFKWHLVGTRECDGGEQGVGEVTVQQSATCKLLCMWIGFLMGVERNVFIAWSISHGVTCLIWLWFFTKWPALSLSLCFFLYPFGIKSNQIVLFRMGEKAYIDRLGSNAQLGVPSGSLLSQLVHRVGWGGAQWGSVGLGASSYSK